MQGIPIWSLTCRSEAIYVARHWGSGFTIQRSIKPNIISRLHLRHIMKFSWGSWDSPPIMVCKSIIIRWNYIPGSVCGSQKRIMFRLLIMKTILRLLDHTHSFMWEHWLLVFMKWDCTTTTGGWSRWARCSMRTNYGRGRHPSSHVQCSSSRRQKSGPSGGNGAWHVPWCMGITRNKEQKKLVPSPWYQSI